MWFDLFLTLSRFSTVSTHLQYANEVCNQTQIRYNIFHDDDSLPVYTKFDSFLETGLIERRLISFELFYKPV